MDTQINTDLLAGMLKEKRGTKGLRAVATEIGGVSAATLSRIEQGKIPDVDTFIKICKWLEVPTDTFVANIGEDIDSGLVSNEQRVVAHLRADRALDKETVDMLVKVISLAYHKTK